MRKLILALFAALLLTPAASVQAQTLLSADFQDDELSPFTASSVASSEDWATSSDGDPDNAPYAVANGFGADEPSNDYLISPALDLSSAEGETLTFLNAKGFDDSGRRGLKVLVSTDYDGSGNPDNFTFTDISDRVTFSQGDFNFVSSGEIDLTDEQFQAEEVYIAFQYQSSGTGQGEAAAWEVDNVEVTADGGMERATVAFNDQVSDGGQTITVASASLPKDGYIVIHDSTLLDDPPQVTGSVIGVSDYLEAGDYTDLQVTLFDVPGGDFDGQTMLDGGQQLIAMPHQETSGNEEYNFITSGGDEDGPYLNADGDPVVDPGFVAVAENGVVPISEARTLGDATVTVEGIVTRAMGNFVRFQDPSGSGGASGLAVRQTGESSAFRQDVMDGTIGRGTRIRLTGTLSEFSGLLQVNDGDLDSYDVLSQDNDLPDPQSLDLADLAENGENYESELVTVDDLTFQLPDEAPSDSAFAAGTTYQIDGPSVAEDDSSVTFRVPNASDTNLEGKQILPGSFTYTGTPSQFTNFGNLPQSESYQLNAVMASEALPVEFAAAPTAAVEDESVTLSWKTLSETNNEGFRVQHRRAEGASSPGWTTASEQVDGAGTTTAANTYAYTVSGLAPGRYVFRVKQIDADGGASFSETVEAQVGAGDFALSTPTKNPFRGQTTLSYRTSGSAEVEAVLYNSLGQQVRELNATGGRITVEAAGLSSGLYFVRLATKGGERADTQAITLVR